MQVNPYIVFNGNCEEALKLYESVLGAKIEMMMRHGEAPPEMKCPPGWEQKIMHVAMTIDGEVIMASDAPSGHYTKPQGFSVSLQVDDPAKAEKVFAGLSEGGEVRMPIAQTFWAKRFGMCSDRFGIPWMVNCP